MPMSTSGAFDLAIATTDSIAPARVTSALPCSTDWIACAEPRVAWIVRSRPSFLKCPLRVPTISVMKPRLSGMIVRNVAFSRVLPPADVVFSSAPPHAASSVPLRPAPAISPAVRPTNARRVRR